MTPTISVVIPAYNAAPTLARALGSVLAQSWPAHEIVVVDDGSADATADVVRQVQTRDGGDRIRFLQQENAGPSAARNRGVKESSGDWIAFLDADDWYYPERLALHARMIAEDPGLDFVVGNFDYRDSAGGLLHASMTTSNFGRELLARHGEDGVVVIEGDALGNYVSKQFSDTRTLTLPRTTFFELGGFALDLKISEDLVFLLRLCARSRRAGVTCSPSAVYSVHDGGLIRSDRLRAQTESVRALLGQAAEMEAAPPPVRDAWRRLVKEAHDDLAYYLVKQGRRGGAMLSVLRSFAFHPAAHDLRTLASMMRG